MLDEQLLQTVRPNHQCQILLLGQRENKKRPVVQEVVSSEQCQAELMPFLEQDWDHIGTTETLQTITLPLLTRIIRINNNGIADEQHILSMTTKKKNASEQRISLQLKTIDEIRQRSSFDLALYERVQKEPWHRKQPTV